MSKKSLPDTIKKVECEDLVMLRYKDDSRNEGFCASVKFNMVSAADDRVVPEVVCLTFAAACDQGSAVKSAMGDDVVYTTQKSCTDLVVTMRDPENIHAGLGALFGARADGSDRLLVGMDMRQAIRHVCDDLIAPNTPEQE